MSKSEVIATQAIYMILVALEYIGVTFLIGIIPFALASIIPNITAWILIVYSIIIVPLIIIILAKTLFKYQKKYFDSIMKVNSQKTVFRLNFIMRLWKEFLWAMVLSFAYCAMNVIFDCLDVCKYNGHISIDDFMFVFRIAFTILLVIYLIQIYKYKKAMATKQ